MLIATRALLGLAGATLAPSTLSLIRNMFLDAEQRTVAIGVWISSYSVGAAIGPLVGGALLEHFWWGSVFLIGVPVMVLLLVVGPMLLPEYRDPDAGRLDLLSAALSLVCVLPVIYGLKQFAQHGASIAAALAVVSGVGAGHRLVFVRRQRQLRDPLIDLRLFAAPAFSAALGAVYAGHASWCFGVFVFIEAQYLQMVLGLSPLQAGMWSDAFQPGRLHRRFHGRRPRLTRHARPAYVMAGGLLLSAAGLRAADRGCRALGAAALVGGLVIYSLGLALVFTLSTDLIIGSAPPERAGAAAAISETSSEAWAARWASPFSAAWARRCTAPGWPSVSPRRWPPTVWPRHAMTLGGALKVADRLAGAARRASARRRALAFTDAMDWVSIACLAVVLVTRTRVMSVLVLRTC